MTIKRPSRLRLDAWDAQSARAIPLRETSIVSGFQQRNIPARILAPPYIPEDWDWRSPDVGWGLILAENEALSPSDKALGLDAPEAIRRLVEARAKAPILRYRSTEPDHLTRYYTNGDKKRLSASAPVPGTREGQIPKYLLIYGTPTEVPWAAQFALNMSAFVGRLDLRPEEGLDNYVNALIGEWSGEARGEASKPVVWSADLGGQDITSLMAKVIGGELAKRFADYAATAGGSFMTAADATCDALITTLKTKTPGLICTTSHGMTGPLSNPKAAIASLGLPIDSQRNLLQLPDILDWQAGGAIWYAHACCSAGSVERSRYEDVLGADPDAGTVLKGLAQICGARVAPLPRALLGQKNPLGAFVGFVEPTFDWTLRDPRTKQPIAHTIVHCLYDRLYTRNNPAPIGWALANLFKEAGVFYGAWAFPNDATDRETLQIYNRLAAINRQSMMIIGDPTVRLQ